MRNVFAQYRGWSIGVALTLLCIMGGAILSRLPAKAQEELPPRLFCPGPMGLTRGQTSRHIFHLHDDSRAVEATCHLTLEDAQGNSLVDTEFSLTADHSVIADLSVLEDGRVLFNGKQVGGNIDRRSRLEIIPCFRVENLPRSVALYATAQCADNLAGDPHTPVNPGRTTYILPYLEATSSLSLSR